MEKVERLLPAVMRTGTVSVCGSDSPASTTTSEKNRLSSSANLRVQHLRGAVGIPFVETHVAAHQSRADGILLDLDLAEFVLLAGVQHQVDAGRSGAATSTSITVRDICEAR